LQKSFCLFHPAKSELKKISSPTRWTEGQLITAVWRNSGFSASYDSFVGKQTLMLRINICGENPPLRQAAKRQQDNFNSAQLYFFY
jgi:hypothetical protein